MFAIIVHFGEHGLTRETAASLRRAAGVPAGRIVVVENGMPSGIREDEARVVSLPENRGYAAGVNAGMMVAFAGGAEAVLVLNNDVLVPPGALPAMLAVCAHDPRVGCVGALVEEPGRRIPGGGRVSWARGRVQFSSAHDRRPPEFISGACFLLTRACVEDAGGLPEEYFLYWEDVAYGFHLRRRGWKLALAATPPVLHRHSAGTQGTSDRKTYYLVRNGVRFARAYAPPGSRAWLRALEPVRRAFAAARGRWAVLRGLRDAAAGVTGPLPEDVDLTIPP